MATNRSGQIQERVDLLELTGARHRKQPLDGAFPVITAIPEHDPAPLDRGSRRALRDVMVRLDAALVDVGKEMLMMDELGTGPLLTALTAYLTVVCRLPRLALPLVGDMRHTVRRPAQFAQPPELLPRLCGFVCSPAPSVVSSWPKRNAENNREDKERLRMVAKNYLSIVMVALAILMVTSTSARAQAGLATIVGQVTDTSGASLPGATVTVSSPALQVREVSVVTDPRGEYRVTSLPIGVYSIAFALDGFRTSNRLGIRLTAGFTAKIDVELQLGSLQENVTVTGVSPIVDVTSSTSTTTFTRETLEALPTSRDSLIAILAQTPGARTNIDVGGSTMADVANTHLYGRDQRPWTVVEGVFSNSPTLRQGGQYFDYNAMDEVAVSSFAHDASIGLPGEAITVVLKSGSNKSHGDLVWGWTNNSLSTNNVSEDLRVQGISVPPLILRRWDFGGTFSGKIVEDKVWFLGAARLRYNDNGVLGCVKGKEGGGQHPATDQCENDAQTLLYTGKVSYQLDPNNRFVGFYEYNEKNTLARSQSALITWRARTGLDQYGLIGKAEWTRTLGSRGVFEANYGYWNLAFTPKDIPRNGIPYQRDLFSNITDGDAPSSGGVMARVQFHATTSWNISSNHVGTHAVKVGFDHFQQKQEGFTPVNPTGDYQLVFNNTVPFQFVASAAPIASFIKIFYTTAYLQDQWRLTKRLTLNLGLRFAHDNMWLPEQSRTSGQFFTAQTFPEVNFAPLNTVVPRVSAAFDVTGKGTTVVKGGWARYAELRDTAIGSAVNKNGGASRTFRWRDGNGDRLYQPGEVDLSLTGPDIVASSASNTQIPNPDEKPYFDDELSVSFEHQLTGTLAVRLTGVFDRQTQVPRLLNTRIPPEAYNIAITKPIPAENGVAAAGAPLGTITYYEYSSALSGLQFQVPTIVDDPNATRRWSTIETALTKRLSSRWLGMVAYSATKRNEPLAAYIPQYGGFRRSFNGGTGAWNPNEEINSADRTWEWTARLNGSYQLPWDVVVAANYQIISGERWARTALFTGGTTIPSIVLNVEPIGTRAFPVQHVLDIRLEKRLKVLGNPLGLKFEVFNVPNANTIQSANIQSGSTFLRPLSILPGRDIQFGVSYRF